MASMSFYRAAILKRMRSDVHFKLFNTWQYLLHSAFFERINKKYSLPLKSFWDWSQLSAFGGGIGNGRCDEWIESQVVKRDNFYLGAGMFIYIIYLFVCRLSGHWKHFYNW